MKSHWHLKLLKTLIVTMIGSSLGACAKGTHVFSMQKTAAVPSSSMHLITIVPVAAKPGDEVTITGSGLGRQSVVRIGGQAVDFTSYSDTSAKFIMPQMPRSGAFGVTIGRYNEGTGTVSAAAKFMLADATDADYPIYMATVADICSPISFRDAQGDIRIGTKDCAPVAATVADCAADGAIGCKTVAAFPAANAATAVAGNIKSGVSIGGISGSFAGSFSNCSTAGERGCITSGTYYAGEACAADASNCFLPTYAVATQPLKAISFNAIDPAKMLDSLTLSGVRGTVVSRGSWDLTFAFPGAGYYTAVTAAPAATAYASGTTFLGVAGSAAEVPGDCNSAGQQNCVAKTTYFAGTACGADGSACYLPNYAGSEKKKAIDFSTIDGAKMLTTSTVSGVVGTIASKGSWVLTDVFPGAGYYSGVSATPSAATIATNTTILGVAGSATLTPADCTANASVGCVTTTTYKSGDLTSLTAGNIKSGVTIAGTVGAYPSADNRLTGSSLGTADLDAQFRTKLTSALPFEYFDSTGAVYTEAGDADIIPAKIASGVEIFGTTGTITSPIAWDLRAGSSIVSPSGTVAGLLKVNCRNGATLTTFDQSEYPKSATADNTTDFLTVTAHGWSDTQTVKIYYSTAPTGLDYSIRYFVVNSTTNTFQLSLTSGGSAINFTANGAAVFVYKQGNGTTEIWDTIDDYYGSASATPTYTGWSSDNQCGGIDTPGSTSDDANVWKDVTTTNGSTASTCTGTPASCSFKDKISGQEWHKADTLPRDWTTALSYCDNLTYNFKTDWRLPSQKELMEAYNHGLMSTDNSTNWITSANFQQSYWSASSSSTPISNAWNVSLGNGFTSYSTKYATYRVICVRP